MLHLFKILDWGRLLLCKHDYRLIKRLEISWESIVISNRLDVAELEVFDDFLGRLFVLGLVLFVEHFD